MFGPRTKIHQLARKTGNFAVISFDKQDHYWLRSMSGRLPHEILVKHHPKRTTTRFQCWLPVDFPLNNPPSGLFGRLLMRSWDLAWSSWVLNIGNSCEATACVTALIPSVALDARLFDEICCEQAREVAAFHKELREKFNWAGQGGGPAAVSARQAGTGVPMVRPDGLPECVRALVEGKPRRLER